jgi:hypothetical protein
VLSVFEVAGELLQESRIGFNRDNQAVAARDLLKRPKLLEDPAPFDELGYGLVVIQVLDPELNGFGAEVLRL